MVWSIEQTVAQSVKAIVSLTGITQACRAWIQTQTIPAGRFLCYIEHGNKDIDMSIDPGALFS